MLLNKRTPGWFGRRRLDLEERRGEILARSEQEKIKLYILERQVALKEAQMFLNTMSLPVQVPVQVQSPYKENLYNNVDNSAIFNPDRHEGLVDDSSMNVMENYNVYHLINNYSFFNNQLLSFLNIQKKTL